MKYLTLFFLLVFLAGCGIKGSKTAEKHTMPDTTYQISRDWKGDTSDIKTLVNGEANGEYRSYYSKGKLWCKNYYVDGKLEGEELVYTAEGEIAERNFWKNSRLHSSKIYWQFIPFTNRQEFYFLSDTGVYRVKDGKHVYGLESKPPEGFIVDKYNVSGPTVYPEYYVFRDGKFELWPNPRVKKE